ncbi:MAG TPA: hypothetical protein H9781_05590, partial [Candidatus Oscillibacter excrementavium]|nr:hypothetical protein [Candidatus Oscillibacter excrementavium]
LEIRRDAGAFCRWTRKPLRGTDGLGQGRRAGIAKIFTVALGNQPNIFRGTADVLTSHPGCGKHKGNKKVGFCAQNIANFAQKLERIPVFSYATVYVKNS